MQKFATYRSCQYPKHRSDSEVQSDQNDQAICSQISSNVELLPQFFALHHHGDPGHGTSDSGQFENPAVGVARGDVLGLLSGYTSIRCAALRCASKEEAFAALCCHLVD
jgi:hypothetical protein